jgi:hypothetical protein
MALNDSTASVNALKLAQAAAKIGTNRSGNVSTTTSQLLAANPNRNWLLIKNDQIVAIWINLGGTPAASAGSGNISINAGTLFTLQGYTGAVSAISSAGTLAITAVEF